jgi:hypothetical protein
METVEMAMDDRFLKKLLSNMKCGVCGQHYQLANIIIIGHQEDLWLLSLYCPGCRNQSLIAAVIKEGKAPEVVTELTEAEKSKLFTPIGLDDVIDIHTFLNDFSGDFSSLFSDE